MGALPLRIVPGPGQPRGDEPLARGPTTRCRLSPGRTQLARSLGPAKLERSVRACCWPEHTCSCVHTHTHTQAHVCTHAPTLTCAPTCPHVHICAHMGTCSPTHSKVTGISSKRKEPAGGGLRIAKEGDKVTLKKCMFDAMWYFRLEPTEKG